MPLWTPLTFHAEAHAHALTNTRQPTRTHTHAHTHKHTHPVATRVLKGIFSLKFLWWLRGRSHLFLKMGPTGLGSNPGLSRNFH